MSLLQHHQVIIVGAGPGGISVASALQDRGVQDVLIIDEGEVGQSWLDYPKETHLLSESSLKNDDNVIADVSTTEVFPHIGHPSHEVYQKYLAYVVSKRKLAVQTNTKILRVYFDQSNKNFVLEGKEDTFFTCKMLVWAAGMYATPNEQLETEGCFIHYAHMPYMDSITSDEVMVVGSANGASGVVLELAKPGRLVTMVTSHPYEVPHPIDCLWKEQMQFIKDLQNQGLVKIVENFRVKSIYGQEGHYILESEDGQKLHAKKKPIICTGFLPNVEPIKDLVDQKCMDHDTYLELDEFHQSTRQPGLFVAGVIGKFTHDEGMISKFREFGKVIATKVSSQVNS